MASSVDQRIIARADTSIDFGLGAEAIAAMHFGAEYDHSLTRLIESEIIPRLMVAHACDRSFIPTPSTSDSIQPGEVEALVPLALQVEADALLGYVEVILSRGVAFDTVMVDLLAPAARLLGQFWEDDYCDFLDVAMGLWRLQEVVHEVASRSPVDPLLGAGGYRALFSAMPGDKHNFGTVVLDELFRQHGWITDRIGGAETPELLKRLADDWFDMVGLTVSLERHIGNLTSIIVAARNVSRNPRLCVMVGGRVFSENPDLASQVGADGTARDAKIALDVATRLVCERELSAPAL